MQFRGKQKVAVGPLPVTSLHHGAEAVLSLTTAYLSGPTFNTARVFAVQNHHSHSHSIIESKLESGNHQCVPPLLMHRIRAFQLAEMLSTLSGPHGPSPVFVPGEG
jgi:hypothetical protein